MRLSAYLRFAVDEIFRMERSQPIQATIYDTCWAARITESDGSRAYPELLEWLMDRQNPDGSWGSQVPYVHDRLLSTLAVVLLLARHGYRKSDLGQKVVGERYIWQNVGRLHHDAHRPVGFEMIMPALLAEGRELGVKLPYSQLRYYDKQRDEKLSMLPMSRFFERPTAALFSLEGFAEEVDFSGAENVLLANGSMLASPSATASLMSQFPDWRERYPTSASYLEDLLSHHGAGLPAIAPYDVFSRAWMLYYLQYGELLNDGGDLLQPHYDHLLRGWQPEEGGIGFSSLIFPDSDDTAAVLLAFSRAGWEADGSCLLSYEREENFAVYDYELDPSVSANLNILEALHTLPETDRARARDKILAYLFRARRHGSFWSDKWHCSDYYPTSKALMAMSPHVAQEEMEDTLRWLLFTQRESGAWGQYMPTSEETAYVLLALLNYHRTVRPLSQEPLRRAAEYLIANEHPFKGDYPELWITKVLYSPTFVIRCAILAALNLYLDTFGDLE